jgi:hypothetical protein
VYRGRVDIMDYRRVEELNKEATEAEDNDEAEQDNEVIWIIVKYILKCAEELKELGYEL